MKDEREHIDDLFKEGAEKQSFNIPDSFLKDLDARLDNIERKKKRRGLWWLLFLPVGICAFLYYSSVSNNKTSKNDINIDQKKTEKIIDNEENIDSVFSIDPRTANDPAPNDLEGPLNDEALSPPSLIKEKTKVGLGKGLESTVISVPNTSNISKKNKVPKVKHHVSSSNDNLTSKEMDSEINDNQAMASEKVSTGELISPEKPIIIDRSAEDAFIIDEVSKAIDSSTVEFTDSIAKINDIDSTDEMTIIENRSQLLAMDTLSPVSYTHLTLPTKA